MWGAVAGDIIGSRFEFLSYKSKQFELFTPRDSVTDDSLMTIAVAKALTEHGGEDDIALSTAVVADMKEIALKYPDSGWGSRFRRWLFEDSAPYRSFGNGAAMRVSPVGWYAATLDEVYRLSFIVTSVSHNHPEGRKGAECVAAAIFLAKRGYDKRDILNFVAEEYYPRVRDMRVDEIRKTYCFDETCQGSVPQALACFFEGRDFEDTVRNAVSLGGDADTLAAIAGSVAEAYFGIPDNIKTAARKYLGAGLLKITDAFEKVKKP